MTLFFTKPEQPATALAVISGAVAAAFVAPWDSLFLANFAWYWLPQAAVLLVLLFVVPPHYSFFGGVSTSLTIYFLVFAWWMFSRDRADSMAWLGYFYSLPGAAVGAALSRLFLVMKPKYGILKIAITAATGTLLGVGLNQTAVCTTLFYCLGR
jgi:hypothetical protein